MKFKYRQTILFAPFSKKQKLLRPIIPASLNYKAQSVYYEALIDSGADFCIFPIEIAKKLGINLKKANKIYFAGATGEPVSGLREKVLLQIGSISLKTEVVFADLSDKAALLGQYGFFDQCKVVLDLNKNEIEIIAAH